MEKKSLPLHQKAFWGISFFLGGVLLMSLLSGVERALIFALLISGLITLAFFIFSASGGSPAGRVALLSIGLMVGAGYYAWHDNRYQASFTAPIGAQTEFTGVVERVVHADESQTIDLKLQGIPLGKGEGKIRVFAQPYPELRYGDVIMLTGTLKELPEDRRGYYAKEGIGAVMSFPKELTITGHGQGSAIKAALYSIRDRFQQGLERALPPQQATLMTGLTLGKSVGFSKEFNEKLRATGTTHIVALSGQNISIIMVNLTALLALIFSRRATLAIGMLLMIGFVLMTGAEASVVRAALMATILVIAERSGRLPVMKNTLAVAAFAMIIQNPKILAFDVGFQLSFLAVMGIVYLQPALRHFFRIPENKGLLAWRDNLWTTISAQLAVLPILLLNFGFFPPLAIITNVLILGLIPMTMLWGFVIFFVSLVSTFLSIIVALPVRLLLWYELGIIELFSKVSFGITVESFSTILILIYYAVLIWFMLKIDQRQKREPLLI